MVTCLPDINSHLLPIEGHEGSASFFIQGNTVLEVCILEEGSREHSKREVLFNGDTVLTQLTFIFFSLS